MTNTLSNFTIHGAISPRLSHLTSTVTRKRGRKDRYHELLFQMRRLRLRFAQDHAASRWTNGDSHHGFLSQNSCSLQQMMLNLPSSWLLRQPAEWPHPSSAPLQLPAFTAVTGGLTMGSHLDTPLLGNKTVLETVKQWGGAGGQGRAWGDGGCTYISIGPSSVAHNYLQSPRKAPCWSQAKSFWTQLCSFCPLG